MNKEGVKNLVTTVAGTLSGTATLVGREGQNIVAQAHISPEQVGATAVWVLAIGVLGALVGRGVYTRFTK